MATDLVQKYATYLELIKNKLDAAELPAKHKNREEQYKTFLKREIAVVEKKLEAAKMAAPKK